MSLRPSYPDISVGAGFRFIDPKNGAAFSAPVLVNLHKQVSDYCKANGFHLSNDEFDENVCQNTPNIVCTESARGAGDVVHQILNPISKMVDSILGTETQGCHGCYQRQAKLNK